MRINKFHRMLLPLVLLLTGASARADFGRLYTADLLGNTWSEPAPLEGLGQYQRTNYPFMMSDGTTLYFAAISDEGLDFSDGLFSADPGFTRYEKSFRYWAMAHFSRFIPAGSQLLPFAATPDDYRKSTYDRRVDTDFAAFRTPNCKTVVVISNEGPEKTIRLQTPGLHMSVYTTDETRRLEQTYNGRRLLSLTIPAVSVTTVVIDNDIGGLFQ